MGFWDAVVGGRSVGVPGLLRMLELAHRDHGRLPWARLFQPAIGLAERGFAVSPRLAGLIATDKHLKTFPGAAAISTTLPATRGRPATCSGTRRSPKPCAGSPSAARTPSTPAPSRGRSWTPCAGQRKTQES